MEIVEYCGLEYSPRYEALRCRDEINSAISQYWYIISKKVEREIAETFIHKYLYKYKVARITIKDMRAAFILYKTTGQIGSYNEKSLCLYSEDQLTETRVCKKCGEEKPFNKFAKIKTAIGGRGHICNSCKKKKYRQSEAGKRAIKLYRELNKDDLRAKEKIYKKIYNKRHPEIVKARQLRYKKRHPDRINKKNRRRYKRHMEALTDRYVIHIISHTKGIPEKTIRKYPELIESYRQQIKLKRLLKQKKNENNETS